MRKLSLLFFLLFVFSICAEEKLYLITAKDDGSTPPPAVFAPKEYYSFNPQLPKVNVITGEYCEEECDLIVAGIEPLSFRRFYGSQGYKDECYGHWRINPEAFFLFNFDVKDSEKFGGVGYENGGFSLYEKGNKDAYWFDSQKNFYFTNGEAVTGQNHPLNTRILYKKGDKNVCFCWEGVIEEGERKRYFKTDRKKWAKYLASPPYQAKIHTEKRPNGNIIVYDYDKYKEEYVRDCFILKSMTAYSSQGVCLGSLKIDYHKKGDWVTQIDVEGSDKRSAQLKHDRRHVYKGRTKYNWKLEPIYENDIYDVILRSASSCWKPTQYYQYKWEKAKKYFENRFMSQAGQEGGRLLETHYDGDKVKCQVAPVGENDQMVPIAQYAYHRLQTITYDGENNKTVFRYNKQKRITDVEKYLGDQLYSIEKSEWNRITGNLIKKTLEDAFGNILIQADFIYDSQHNLTQESINQDTITRKFKGTLLKSESDRPGKKVKYTYVPDTNLIQTEFVKDHNTICKRTFHFYDDQIGSARCKTIIDDGRSENPQDLTGVTYRRILEIIPKRKGDCIGLPEQITEKTLGPNGHEIQLRRVFYTYHPSGKIIQEDYYDAHDRLSHSIKNDYDKHERLKATTDPLGNTTTFHYDNNFNLICQRGPLPNQRTEWVYDKANRPIAEKKWLEDDTVLITQKKYDKASRLIVSIDECGFGTHYIYDSLGRLTSHIHPGGAITSKEYDIQGNVTLETDPNGYSIRKEYNFRGQPTAIYKPDGSEEHFVYNDNGGTLASHTDAQGTKTVYTYDIFDRPIKTETYSSNGELLKTTSATYSTFHKLSETDGEGNITHYRYDYAGRKIAEVFNGKETLYFYDSLGRLYQTQTADVLYEEIFDPKDQLVEKNTKDLDGNLLEQERYVYDAAGNKTHTINSKGVLETLYNTLGLPIQKIDALGNSTYFSFSYTDGFVQTETDPLGIQTIHIHDPRKNEIETIKKNTHGQEIQKVKREFDPNQNCTKETHSVFEGTSPLKTITHTWNYGPCNRLESLLEAGEKKTSYLYDNTGKRIAVIKPDQTILHSAYDALARLSRHFATDFDYIYAYDKNDRLLSVLDAITQERTTRAYDRFGNITQEVLANGLALAYVYDNQSRRVTSIYPDQTTAHYDYRANKLYQIRRQNLKYTYTERDLEGNPTYIDLPVGRIDIERDSLSRWKHFASPFYTAVFSSDSYDPVGNLCHYRFSDSIGPKNCSYTYDDLRQLTSENEHSYSNDSLHNRLAKDNHNYTLNTLSEITHDGANSYIYDQNGNMLSDGTHQFSYDSLDRLTSVSYEDNISLYAYDPFNRRLSKTINGEKTLYFYDDQNEIGSTDAEGNIKELRILGEGLGAEIGASAFFELYGKIYIPIHDHRGCVATLIDPEAKTAAATYRYTAFGEELATPTLGQPFKVYCPWRFASKRVDTETGFVYFGRRYYSPSLGRWITPDPQGFADGPNLYAYVKNSPLFHYDLYGLTAAECARGCAFGTRDFFWNGFCNTGPHMMSLIQSRMATQWQIVSNPVGYYTGLYNTARDFVSSIPEQLGMSSFKQGASNAGFQTIPKTMEAFTSHHPDSFSKGYAWSQSFWEGVSFGAAAYLSSTSAISKTRNVCRVVSGTGSIFEESILLPQAAQELKAAAAADQVNTKTAEFVLNSWSQGTFSNRMQSIRYHWLKHGNGSSLEEYTKKALDFFEKNRDLAQKVKLKNGQLGYSIKLKENNLKTGGFWTEEGKIVTFWEN